MVGNGDAPESMNENADAPESILVKYGVQTEAQNAEQGAPKKDELVGAAGAEANDQDETHKDNILSEILLAEIDDQEETKDEMVEGVIVESSYREEMQHVVMVEELPIFDIVETKNQVDIQDDAKKDEEAIVKISEQEESLVDADEPPLKKQKISSEKSCSMRGFFRVVLKRTLIPGCGLIELDEFVNQEFDSFFVKCKLVLAKLGVLSTSQVVVNIIRRVSGILSR
jgi:hypothetical protein